MKKRQSLLIEKLKIVKCNCIDWLVLEITSHTGVGYGPMSLWMYKNHALPSATQNNMDYVTINVKDSKGKVFTLTVSKDIAERMKNGE